MKCGSGQGSNLRYAGQGEQMASKPAPRTRGPGRRTQGVTKVRGAARPVQEGGRAPRGAKAVPGDYKGNLRTEDVSTYDVFSWTNSEVCFPNTGQGTGCSELETELKGQCWQQV